MTQLPYKGFVSVLDDIKDFINNTYSNVSGSPIIDPFDDSGNIRGTGTGLASIEDEEQTQNMPKIVIYPLTMPRTKLGAGKSDYRELHRYQIIIKYTCHRSHTWTYDSVEYKGTRQCIKYLEYIGDQLKKYSGSFIDMNEITIGEMSQPLKSPDNLTYTGILPVKIDSYGRL